MVSELVTNAIVHGLTAFDVTVEVAEAELRVEVTDHGHGVPTVQTHIPPSNERGRGLRIVSELSDRWGVDGVEDLPGKRVWFELALPSSRASV